MKKSEYKKYISDLTVSQQKKNELIEKMYALREEKREPEKAKEKEKTPRVGLWVSIVATGLILIMIGTVVGVVLLPTITYDINVDLPISKETRQYLRDTMQNAQYLPNAKLLASEESYKDSSSSGIALSNEGYSQEIKPEENFLEEDDLRIGLKGFDKINDSLGILTQNVSGNFSVEDIKEELSLMLKLMPGFDQWFMMPYSLSALPENYNYSSYMYRISYDETSGHITMTRIIWTISVSIFDSEKRLLYSSQFENHSCYQREVLNVEYYFDEQGREVVECNNTHYYKLQNNYYPVSLQVMRNVKDTQFTKLAIYFTEENDLVKEYVQSNSSIQIDRVYTLQDINKYGAVVNFVQLDYQDSDNISFFQLMKNYPTMYTGNPITTNISFYGKTDESMVFYTEAWDYYDYVNSAEFQLKREYRYYLSDIVEALTRTPSSYYYYKNYCADCQRRKFRDSDVVVSCPHIMSCDKITRGEKEVFYNKESIYRDENIIRNCISTALGNMSQCVLGKAMPLEQKENTAYAFEYAIDGFAIEFVKSYVDNVFDFDSIVQSEKDATASHTYLEEKQLNKILEKEFITLKSFTNKTAFNGESLNYDYAYEITEATADMSKEYYMSLYLKDSDVMLVLDSQKIDMSKGERKGQLKGRLSYTDILDRCVWLYEGNEAYSGEIYVGLIAYDEEDNAQIIFENVLHLQGDKWQKEFIYDKDGKLMRYYFLSDKTFYFNFYVYY